MSEDMGVRSTPPPVATTSVNPPSTSQTELNALDNKTMQAAAGSFGDLSESYQQISEASHDWSPPSMAPPPPPGGLKTDTVIVDNKKIDYEFKAQTVLDVGERVQANKTTESDKTLLAHISSNLPANAPQKGAIDRYLNNPESAAQGDKDILEKMYDTLPNDLLSSLDAQVTKNSFDSSNFNYVDQEVANEAGSLSKGGGLETNHLQLGTNASAASGKADHTERWDAEGEKIQKNIDKAFDKIESKRASAQSRAETKAKVSKAMSSFISRVRAATADAVQAGARELGNIKEGVTGKAREASEKVSSARKNLSTGSLAEHIQRSIIKATMSNQKP